MQVAITLTGACEGQGCERLRVCGPAPGSEVRVCVVTHLSLSLHEHLVIGHAKPGSFSLQFHHYLFG